MSVAAERLFDPLELRVESLRQLIMAEQRPILLELWADWCLFSRLLRPKTQRLAHTWGKQAIVARCRVTGDESVLVDLRVRYLPTMLLIVNGRAQRRWIGDMPIAEPSRALGKLIEKGCP